MADEYAPMDDIPDHISCSCGGQMRRVFTAPAFHMFREHLNHSVGAVVGDKRQFKTALYEAQEKMTERLGFQQHYAEVDPVIVNDSGMKETHDVRKAQGLST